MFRQLFTLAIAFSSLSLFAEATREIRIEKSSPAKALRVGGSYKVSAIEKKADGLYHIEFTSLVRSGVFDRIVLVSDHVHVRVEKGAEIRISAEIAKGHGEWAEASQVLLFLPVGDTTQKIWMLSANSTFDRLNGSRYLEMHSPASDYSVL